MKRAAPGLSMRSALPDDLQCRIVAAAEWDWDDFNALLLVCRTWNVDAWRWLRALRIDGTTPRWVLEKYRDMVSLRRLVVDSGPAPFEGWCLRHLPRLRDLRLLCRTAYTSGADLAEYAPKLRVLILCEWPMFSATQQKRLRTDWLQKLTRLRELGIWGHRGDYRGRHGSRSGVFCLRNLTELQSLTVGTNVAITCSNDVLANLRSVTFDTTRLVPDFLARIGRATALRELRFVDSGHVHDVLLSLGTNLPPLCNITRRSRAHQR